MPYQGTNPVYAFMGKSLEKKLADQMKGDFGPAKKSRGYFISSITDEAMWFAAQVLAGKIMWKCRVDEVSAPVISLVV